MTTEKVISLCEESHKDSWQDLMILWLSVGLGIEEVESSTLRI